MKDLETLFVRGLREIYDGEHLLVQGLSELKLCADSRKLKAALFVHLGQTKKHVTRLQQVFEDIGQTADRIPCAAIEGIIDEAQLRVMEFRNNSALDAALIATAQKAEHYEISTYNTLCLWAGELGYESARELLEKNLKEERQTDALLTVLAEWAQNPYAQRRDTTKETESAATRSKAVAFGQ
jgi:ferritin-like metal-binding protein YciE